MRIEKLKMPCLCVACNTWEFDARNRLVLDSGDGINLCNTCIDTINKLTEAVKNDRHVETEN
jgi:hypothetical protein